MDSEVSLPRLVSEYPKLLRSAPSGSVPLG